MKNNFKFKMLSVALLLFLSSCKPNLASYDIIEKDKERTEDNLQESSVTEGGAQESSQKPDSPYSPPDRVYLDEEELVTLTNEKTGIKAAGGIWVNQDNIVVSDQVESKLVVLDKEGKVLHEVGKIGSGPLEFSNPTDLFYNEEDKCLYVLDNGNYRVQILSDDLEFKKEVSFSKMKELDIASSDFRSIVVKKDAVYISLKGTSKETLHIYRVSFDGSLEETELISSGVLFKDKDKVYLAEMLAFEFMESETSSGFFDSTGTAGQTYLYEVDGIKTKKIAGFPYQYTPSDVVKQGEVYYIASALWNLVEAFQLEGEEFVFQKTLTPQVPFEKSDPNKGFHLSLFETTLYMENAASGDIYVISLEG